MSDFFLIRKIIDITKINFYFTSMACIKMKESPHGNKRMILMQLATW